MFLLVPAHPGCPGQIPQSRKTVVCVCVCGGTGQCSVTNVTYLTHVALPCGCSVPVAELLYLSAMGIAQLVAHEAGKSNLCESSDALFPNDFGKGFLSKV